MKNGSNSVQVMDWDFTKLGVRIAAAGNLKTFTGLSMVSSSLVVVTICNQPGDIDRYCHFLMADCNYQ